MQSSRRRRLTNIITSVSKKENLSLGGPRREKKKKVGQTVIAWLTQARAGALCKNTVTGRSTLPEARGRGMPPFRFQMKEGEVRPYPPQKKTRSRRPRGRPLMESYNGRKGGRTQKTKGKTDKKEGDISDCSEKDSDRGGGTGRKGGLTAARTGISLN